MVKITEKSIDYKAKERGRRIRLLRETTRLSRRKFSEKHGISAGTLQNLEDGRYKGANDDVVQKIVKALAVESIQCSSEWLLYGIGVAPKLPESVFPTDAAYADMPPLSDDEIIQKELQHFHKLTENGIDLIVSDSTMAPAYRAGDLVAGRRRFGQDIKKTIGQDCIVQTQVGETLIRHVALSPRPGMYRLTSQSDLTSEANDVALFSAAPITWIRRKDPI